MVVSVPAECPDAAQVRADSFLKARPGRAGKLRSLTATESCSIGGGARKQRGLSSESRVGTEPMAGNP
jgi:hypothetical protein